MASINKSYRIAKAEATMQKVQTLTAKTCSKSTK